MILCLGLLAICTSVNTALSFIHDPNIHRGVVKYENTSARLEALVRRLERLPSRAPLFRNATLGVPAVCYNYTFTNCSGDATPSQQRCLPDLPFCKPAEQSGYGCYAASTTGASSASHRKASGVISSPTSSRTTTGTAEFPLATKITTSGSAPIFAPFRLIIDRPFVFLLLCVPWASFLVHEQVEEKEEKEKATRKSSPSSANEQKQMFEN